MNRDTKQKPHLLVVDDDSEAIALVQLALKDSFQITAEPSGADAISTARTLHPDAILLDVHMPNVDGYEVLRQLKQHPMTSTIPVLCISADGEEPSRSRACALGAIGYLVKPLDRKTLARDIRALVQGANFVLESPGKNRRFVIAYNPAEKLRLMQQQILADLTGTRRAVVVSLTEGEVFCEGALGKKVEDESLVYLQITPSLLAKFPYLQDLSPVVGDLKSFLGETGAPYALYFDDPHLVLNPKDPKGAVARFHALKETLTGAFDQVCFFCSREPSAELSALMNEMAVLFCR